MIVTGGENVYSGEVEAVVYNHLAVREAAVFGIPHPQWGELVAACVVLKPNMQLTGDGLIQHCRKSLEPAAAADEDGRAVGETRPVLLAPVGRRASDAASVRGDSA